MGIRGAQSALLIVPLLCISACQRSTSDEHPADATSGAAVQAPAPSTSEAEAALRGAPAASTTKPDSTSAAAGVSLNEQQRAITEQQAANARLQQDVERLKPRDVTIPQGTRIAVRPSRDLSTDDLSTGSAFEAVLDNDILVDGQVLAKAGSRVDGIVVNADKGGKVKGVASLTVGVRSIVGPKARVVAVHTDSFTATAESTKKRDAVRTGVATGVGAVIGGIAGGGKGAAIGAGVGAGAGVATNAVTRGEAAVIPAETLIELKLSAPVTLSVQK